MWSPPQPRYGTFPPPYHIPRVYMQPLPPPPSSPRKPLIFLPLEICLFWGPCSFIASFIEHISKMSMLWPCFAGDCLKLSLGYLFFTHTHTHILCIHTSYMHVVISASRPKDASNTCDKHYELEVHSAVRTQKGRQFGNTSLSSQCLTWL